MAGFLSYKYTLLAHVELLINQLPQVLLFRAGLNTFSTLAVFVLGIASALVHHLMFSDCYLHQFYAFTVCQSNWSLKKQHVSTEQQQLDFHGIPPKQVHITQRHIHQQEMRV